MSLTLVLVVLIFAVIVLFSDDFARFGKKLFSIPGFKLCLPVLSASVLIIDFQDIFAWMLDRIMDGFRWCIIKVSTVLPAVVNTRQISAVLLLMASSVFLVILFDRLRIKMGYRPFEYCNQVILILWTIAAILYVCL